MARYSVFRSFAMLLVAFAFAGCAAQRAYREGNDLIEHDQVEAALLKYREAVAADPSNAVYKVTYLRARDAATVRLLEQADHHLAAGKAELAQQAYQRVLSFAPSNERARTGVRKVEAARRLNVSLAAAAETFGRKDYDNARRKLDDILAEQPDHPGALALMEKLMEATALPAADAALDAAFRKPISLEFRDAPLRQVFEIIARHAGLNFMFDKDVRTDTRTSIFLKNSTVEAAVYYLLMTNQLERQVMDRNTILIYPNNPAKLKEYQELAVKTFYLGYGEAKSVAASLKAIVKSRELVVDEKLNLVIMRDTPEAIRLASRMVALLDVPEPEVMLDVEVLEVQHSRITDLGVSWPSNVSLAPLTTSDGHTLTVEELRGLNIRSIGVGGVAATIKAHTDDGDSNILANPRIRVRNKEKANVVIGEKLPIITTTVSPGVGGFASESVSYADVGLTLNVEPTIHLDNEVAIKVSLEVSNVIDSMATKSGSTVYRIGKRSAATLLQLKDGENQVLAGLIRNEDRKSGSKLPLLGDLPLLGHLFGTTNDSRDRTEIVLSITPHLVRNIVRPASDVAIFAAGTDTSLRNRPDPTPAPTPPAVFRARAPEHSGPPAVPQVVAPVDATESPAMPPPEGAVSQLPPAPQSLQGK